MAAKDAQISPDAQKTIDRLKKLVDSTRRSDVPHIVLKELNPGEEVLTGASFHGYANANVNHWEDRRGILVATDRRILARVGSTFIGRTATESFPYGAVSSIAAKPGVFWGHLVLTMSSRVVSFHSISNSRLKEFASVVTTHLHSPRVPPASVSDASSPEGLVAELERLGSLQERGLLTRAEFEQAKGNLLEAKAR